MPNPFLSSEEYDERAHQLYNDGNYDEALAVLKEGLGLYPASVELHTGVGYARLAREEFAWARRSFEEALVLDPEHEDALAGLGETLLRFGQTEAAVRCFMRILELGYQDDVELMLQCGRALFRDGLLDDALTFFSIAVAQEPELVEGIALTGYCKHRLGNDAEAVAVLRKALSLDPDYVEARIYLANIHYDLGEYEAALMHFDRTSPEDHWDELGIWRLLDLHRTLHGWEERGAESLPWEQRLIELCDPGDAIDEMLAGIELAMDDRDSEGARAQLELFGGMLSELQRTQQGEPLHQVALEDGSLHSGSWDDIVRAMREAAQASVPARTVEEFMASIARREYARTGILITTQDAESFLRASADAGLLRILR